MFPTLIHFEPNGLSTYGVAMAVGFLMCVVVGIRAVRRQGIDVNRALDLSFWMLGSGLVGARVLFAVANAGQFIQQCRGDGSPRGLGQVALDCSRALFFWEGGLVWYGGLLTASAVAVWYTRRHRMGFRKTFDVVAPGVVLGHFFGRLGCWSAGCCYGKVTESSLGVNFPPQSLAFREWVLHGVLVPESGTTPPLHPTQLYEALALLVIFFILLWVGYGKRRHGEVLLAYMILYPLARSIIEVFRGDPERQYLVALSTPGLNEALSLPANAPSMISTSQFISLLVILAAGALWVALRRGQPAS